jgi:hypothetical protein
LPACAAVISSPPRSSPKRCSRCCAPDAAVTALIKDAISHLELGELEQCERCCELAEAAQIALQRIASKTTRVRAAEVTKNSDQITKSFISGMFPAIAISDG